ncbi:ArpU family transcriptional regulator [Paenibacillus polymyxa]|uniref:ArpU family phage packaging/lysis transcriptional regulator n=1 Tax=Paenibacillus TaxID=44249 RepID=UPI000D85D23B|nr:ArpU family phage packaging/lysis transcriptional regulator [Paenibacillus polymyxa]QDY81918.1 ArpU family transcriptional regulator [Paenibacillus polymyxa]SPY16924.1 ArpU family phage transcriptional regulator [Paenibacillus polymyxa]
MRQRATQLTLGLPVMDSEQTRRQVEEHLETVRIYRQMGLIRREVSNTPSYEPRFHGNTNAISKPAEDAAVWNADKENELEQKSELLDKAMRRLSHRERELLTLRYLDDEDVYDYNVCQKMHMGERTFRRVKARALYKLAFGLRLEVLVDPPSEKVAAK